MASAKTTAGLDREIGNVDYRSAISQQLQEIVEEASDVLGRPVTIGDRHLRLLAHTQHGENEIDPIRLRSIMRQPQPPEILDWLERHGTFSSDQPFRIPPNAELELDARVGAPVQCHGRHFGLMWCTDRDQTMTDGDLECIGSFADEAAIVLYREILLSDLDRSRERELIRDILSSDDAVRREAAWQLAESGLFTSGGKIAAIVAPLEENDRFPESARVTLDAALMRVRRQLTPRHSLHLLRPNHAVILISLADPGIRARGVRAFAEKLRSALADALPSSSVGGRGQIVAVGGVERNLAGAETSYAQALRTAKVATMVSTFDDVVCWEDLGIYQILADMSIDRVGSNTLHPGVRALMEDARAAELLVTLERYLDFAGDMKQTAASLYLHRTSLYHRLRRIESVAGVDLRKGDDRLIVHLSLKLARLQGVDWSSDEGRDESGKGA